MSTYTNTSWPVVDLLGVCALQSLGSAGTLLLNGSLFNSDLPNQISFIAAGFVRSVSITSTNMLSSVTFVINGFQNGAFVTENITGPNNTTVYGTKYYDIITSIYVSGAVTNVSVGTGKAGYLPLISVNPASTNFSCSVFLPVGSGITYSLFQTLEQIDTNWISFQTQVYKLFPCLGFTNETTSQIGNSTAVTNYLLFNVVNSSNPITDTLNFIFLQE